jgi:hypothetical protein
MNSGSNVVPSISAALALPASAARRSRSRAEARLPLFRESVPRLTSVAISSGSRPVAVPPTCAGGGCDAETGAAPVGALATCNGCDGGGGRTEAPGVGSACGADSLVFVSRFGSDGGTIASACEGSSFTEMCEVGAGGTVAVGSFTSVECVGSDGGTAASACEGSLLRLTEIDGAEMGAGAASSVICRVLGWTIAQVTTAEVSATAQPTAQYRNMIDAKLRSPAGSLGTPPRSAGDFNLKIAEALSPSLSPEGRCRSVTVRPPLSDPPKVAIGALGVAICEGRNTDTGRL